jgi:hypothetical protein
MLAAAAAAAPWRHRRLIRRRRRVLEAEALRDVRLELLVGVHLVGWDGGDPLFLPPTLQQLLLGLAAAAVQLLVFRLGGKAAFKAEITGFFVVFLFLSRVGLGGGGGGLFASVLLTSRKFKNQFGKSSFFPKKFFYTKISGVLQFLIHLNLIRIQSF